MNAQNDENVRFTMLLKRDLQDRIEEYQKDVCKRMKFTPKRTEIMRQALIVFLNNEERKKIKNK